MAEASHRNQQQQRVSSRPATGSGPGRASSRCRRTRSSLAHQAPPPQGWPALRWQQSLHNATAAPLIEAQGDRVTDQGGPLSGGTGSFDAPT